MITDQALQVRGLSRPQCAAARVLADGGTQEAAAEAAGCSDRTIRNWQKGAKFAGALADLRREALEGTAFVSDQGAPDDAIGEQTPLQRATQALEAVLGDPTAADNSRVRAASVVLAQLGKLKERGACVACEDRRVADIEAARWQAAAAGIDPDLLELVLAVAEKLETLREQFPRIDDLHAEARRRHPVEQFSQSVS